MRSLPRKIVEIKAAFGALIADPRSTRMRDELRRKLHALYTLARSYQLSRLAEAVRSCVDILDATRSMPALVRPHIDGLASHISSFSQCAEADTQEPSATPAEVAAAPTGTREDMSRAATVRLPAAPAVPRTGRHSIPPPDLGSAIAEAQKPDSRPSPQPYRTLPPGTMLRKGIAATAGRGAALHILFVGSSLRANALHEALPAEVELLVTRTAADAVQRAKDTAPDVIVAEVGGTADGVALVNGLRTDPVTEFFPVVLVAPATETVDAVRERCPEAVEVLPDAIDGVSLWDALERILGGGLGPIAAGSHEFGDVTLDELARTLQDEIRRGIVGAASPRARGARIALGAGNEVLVATWEAIARIREVVERRSNGAVRFELPSAPRGLPGTHVVTLGGEDRAPEAQDPADDPLPGRRVLVVDDDRAVVTSFSALLREAGAVVSESTDGRSALILARRLQPDLIIADIVMPGLDGFGLCQAIRRDPTLRHTPVVLLSWKDDLLVRMRELGAQAQGYLRKEAGGDAILARVRDALRMRVRLLRRVGELTGAAEVRGRLERVGLVALLDAAAIALGDATVTVSDQWSVTELHLRGGDLVSALRTAHDGSLLRGEAALVPVLGAATARFAVARSTAPARENLSGSLSAVIQRCARRIVALEESLSGPMLLDVVRVEIDREAALAYARALPPRLGSIVERLAAGESPRDLVLRDAMAPSDLEPLLVELSRRGAIQRVLGANGEDLGALRAAADSNAPPVEPARPTRPTMPVEAVKPAEAAKSAPTSTASPADLEALDSLSDVVFRELRDSVVDDIGLRRMSAAPYPAARSSERPPAHTPPPLPESELPPLTGIDETLAAMKKTPANPMPARLFAAANPSLHDRPTVEPSPEMTPTRKVRSIPPPLPREREELAVTAPSSLDVAAALAEVDGSSHTRELPGDVLEALRHSLTEGSDIAKLRATPPPDKPDASKGVTGSALERSDIRAPLTPLSVSQPEQSRPGSNTSKRPPAPPPEALVSRASGARPRASITDVSVAQKAPTAPPEPARGATTDPRPTPSPGSRPPSQRKVDDGAWSIRPALLLLGVGAAFAGSYYGVRWYLSQNAPAPTDAVVPPEPAADDAPTPTLIEGDTDVVGASNTPAPTDAAVLVESDAAPTRGYEAPAVAAMTSEYGAAERWLDGAVLPARSGLLVVIAHEGASVQVDAQDASVTPLQAVLREGMHSVRLRVGDRAQYQLAAVRAGEALVLRAPSGP